MSLRSHRVPTPFKTSFTPTPTPAATQRADLPEARTSLSAPVRVLVTGAGGPAGVAVIRSLLRREHTQVFAADMDGWASGLYLVPAEQRLLLPPGASAHFAESCARLCAEQNIQVLFSTVDAELLPLVRSREQLRAQGTLLANASEATVQVCLDKLALAERCAAHAPVPTTLPLTAAAKEHPWQFPVIVKPRTGSGSRGVQVIASSAALREIPDDEHTIVQAMLPGAEYSVDVLADQSGRVLAAVPRSRERVDSGVSIAGQTINDPELIATATAVAEAIGLQGVANVQLRRAADGTASLLEVNPRFPGALPLTIAAGVDMPALLLGALLGQDAPPHLPFTELAQVRFLEDIFLPPAEILPTPAEVAAARSDA